MDDPLAECVDRVLSASALFRSVPTPITFQALLMALDALMAVLTAREDCPTDE